MATKLAETVIGQHYRTIAADGTASGGPMYYIADGLGWKWLAAAYAFFMGGKALFSTTLIQSNSIAVAMDSTFGVEPWVAGVAVAAVVWLVIVGGIRSIARVATVLTPVMVVFYVAGAFVTLFSFASRIPEALTLIVVGAFDPSALAGGAGGVSVAMAMRYGMARGAYSNEAGNGTAAVFHAAARTSSPARQGLIASLDVFLDTIVICTLTALTVLVSGVWTEGTSTAMVAAGFDARSPERGRRNRRRLLSAVRHIESDRDAVLRRDRERVSARRAVEKTVPVALLRALHRGGRGSRSRSPGRSGTSSTA